ncbi:MAG: hypothetical protein ABGY10_10200 [bacterium]|jgi:hypothetical protein|nr:hypothetical protein [Gemmatimonadota bacterium]
MLYLGLAILISFALPLPIGAGEAGYCLIEGAEYYTVELVTTKNIPGTGLATGRADLSVPANSPFSVAISPDGSYEYFVRVSLERMKIPTEGRLVAWVTTRELDRIERLGTLDQNLRASGKVRWNKFLVVITLEADNNPEQSIWAGPIVFRGMSRSGRMHTMVGHGALQQENCAAYGYAN